MSATTAPVGLVSDRPRAEVLLKPLRLEILGHARTPASASTIAAAMRRPRQVVNYHVRQLARAGFLRRAGRHRKRGLVEQRYVVSARAFLLAPDMLGPVGDASDSAPGSRFPAPAFAADAASARKPGSRLPGSVSAAYLLTLAGRLQREITDSWRQAEASGEPLAVLSLDTEFRFASAEARAQFARALTDAITRLVSAHTVPAAGPARGRCPAPQAVHKLVIGCYPVTETPE